MQYLRKHWSGVHASAPTLEKRYGKYYLRFAFEENVIVPGSALGITGRAGITGRKPELILEAVQEALQDAGLELKDIDAYMDNILAQEHGIPDHRADGELAAEYEEKLKAYDEFVKNG